MAEGRYTRIKSKFWTDEKARKWDSDTKFLALYLLTSPHKNMLGCYVLPRLYICADLGWDLKQLAEPFNKLLTDGFIKYDDGNDLILLSNFLKHNPIENGNQVKAALTVLNELPQSPLLMDLKLLLEQLGKPFLKPLLEQLGKQVTVTVTVNSNSNNYDYKDNLTEIDFEPAELESRSRQVIEKFEKGFGRLLNEIEAAKVIAWSKDFDPELVEHALEISVLGNNRSCKYIGGILSNWHDKGVKCVQDAQDIERKYQDQKKNSNQSKNRASPETKDFYVPPEVLSELQLRSG